MLQFKINGRRLKKLMNDNNIKAYRLSKELDKMGYSISTNTITNYMEERTPPKNLEYVKALADYFNVSTDYLLGITQTPTNNIDIKDICNKYGLTEKSLSALEKINQMNIHFTNQYTVINTVNMLLEEIIDKKSNCIIQSIDNFINLHINNNYEIVIGLDNEIAIWDKKKSNYIWGRKNINGNILIKSILLEIEEGLTQLRETNNRGEK